MGIVFFCVAINAGLIAVIRHSNYVSIYFAARKNTSLAASNSHPKRVAGLQFIQLPFHFTKKFTAFQSGALLPNASTKLPIPC